MNKLPQYKQIVMTAESRDAVENSHQLYIGYLEKLVGKSVPWETQFSFSRLTLKKLAKQS